MSFSYIDIRFTSSANEGHSVHTSFCHLHFNYKVHGALRTKNLKKVPWHENLCTFRVFGPNLFWASDWYKNTFTRVIRSTRLQRHDLHSIWTSGVLAQKFVHFYGFGPIFLVTSDWYQNNFKWVFRSTRSKWRVIHSNRTTNDKVIANRSFNASGPR